MKLSLCQIKPDRNWENSLDIAREALKQAASQGAELAVLPELFVIPYEFSLVETASLSVHQIAVRDACPAGTFQHALKLPESGGIGAD